MSDLAVIALNALTLAPFLACAVAYGWRSPWHRSAIGRVIMGLLMSLCAVLVLAIIVRALGINDPVAMVLRLAALSLVNLAGWALLWQIIALQRSRNSDHPKRRATDH